MKQINIKRLRLLTAIVGILLTFFLIINFAHNPLFLVYYRAKIQTIPDYYRRQITDLIIEIDDIKTEEVKKEIRKKLWTICENQNLSTEKELSPELIAEIQEISEYTKISYIACAFVIMIVAVLLTIWYKSDEKNFVISTTDNLTKRK